MEGDGFDELFFGHAARLVRLAALLGDRDPEDVVQEAFCRVYAARDRLLRDARKLVAYLNRVVVNEVRDRHRRRTTALRKAHLLVPAPAGSSEPGDRPAVLAALGRLPQRRREALVVRYWLDLPLDEIATAMDVRVGTVKSLISRGLDSLAVDLEVDR